MRKAICNSLEIYSLSRLLLILCLFLVGSFTDLRDACAEASEGESTSSRESSSSSEKQERLAPLDMWVPVKPSDVQSDESVDSKNDTPPNNYVVIEDDEVLDKSESVEKGRNSRKLSGSAKKRKYIPSRKSRKRLKRAIAAQRKRVLIYRQEVRRRYNRDSRAEPEFRACTLNFYSHGLRSEIRRLLKKKTDGFLKKEKSLLAAIDKAKCDIVAVQGIIGRDRKWAENGLKRFARKLTKVTGESWEGFVGDSNHKLIRNGFLLKSDSAEVVSLISHTDKLLPKFDAFVETKFSRSPFEIILRVAKKGDKETRVISLVTMDFEKGLGTRNRDAEVFRMQMAEALRQLVVLRRQTFPSSDNPVMVVLGDRASRRYSASAQILEGGLRLTDFKAKDDACSLDENDRIQCQQEVHHARDILGLFAADLKMVSKLTDGSNSRGNSGRFYGKEAKRVRREQIRKVNVLENEVYVAPDDLRNVMRSQRVSGYYSTGYVKVDNGLKYSPLLWVEMNW